MLRVSTEALTPSVEAIEAVSVELLGYADLATEAVCVDGGAGIEVVGVVGVASLGEGSDEGEDKVGVGIADNVWGLGRVSAGVGRAAGIVGHSVGINGIDAIRTVAVASKLVSSETGTTEDKEKPDVAPVVGFAVVVDDNEKVVLGTEGM